MLVLVLVLVRVVRGAAGDRAPDRIGQIGVIRSGDGGAGARRRLR